MKCFAHTNSGRFELRRPETESEWDRYHCIRERALWSRRDMVETFGPYDRDHPEQYGDDYAAMILLRNGIIIGTLCLQDTGEFGLGREIEVRGAAIDPACRGQGYGGIMLMLADRYASLKGYRRAGVWAGPDMVLFYARAGYIYRPPHIPPRLQCPLRGGIPMTKRLDLGVAQNVGAVLIAAA